MSDLHEALTDLKAACPPQLTSIAMRLAKAINDQSIEMGTLRHGLDLADRRYQALEKQNAELLAALKDITVLAPAGSLAQHKAYFAIAGCEKTGALQPSTQEVSNER